jgi:integrase
MPVEMARCRVFERPGTPVGQAFLFMLFHDLRHRAATLVLKMGVHPKQVQELLGHSIITITMDLYSHVLPSMQREMMDQLDELFQDDQGFYLWPHSQTVPCYANCRARDGRVLAE